MPSNTPPSSRKRAGLLIGVGVFLLPLALGWGALACWTSAPGRSWSGPPAPILQAEARTLQSRVQAHVEALAGDIGPRHMGEPETMTRAVAYIEGQLKGCGYASVQRAPVESPLGTTYNLEVAVPGVQKPDEAIVVGAHYDTVAQTPGADDNASGVAAVIELACALRTSAPARTLRFVLFTHEEPPYFKTDQMGSLVYAAEAHARGDRIKAMYSMEMLGYFDSSEGSQTYPPVLGWFYPSKGDYVAFVSTEESSALMARSVGIFRKHAKIASEGIAAPGWVEGVDFSDHWSFARYGYPAVMVTDTAFMRNAHYHEPTDTPDTLDYLSLARVVEGMVPVLQAIAASPEP